MLPVFYQKFISREDLILNPKSLFIFGDNTIRQGYGGQAKYMRGEPNAFGIATLWRPGQYFEDKDYAEIVQIIGRDLDKLELTLTAQAYTLLVFPSAGIGTGLAFMRHHAPQAYDFLSSQLLIRFGIENCTIETLVSSA